MNKLKQLIVALAPRIGLMALAIGLVMALCSGTASAAPVSTTPVMQVAQAQVIKTTVVSAPTAAPKTYTVKSGDTLGEIAAAHGTSVPRLAAANGIANVNVIGVGQVLKLNGSAAPAPKTVAHTAPAKDTGVPDSVWDDLAQCESGGNWSINTGNGFSGGLQFTPSTWKAFGGTGKAHQASREEQIRVAENVLEGQGWKAWPACTKKLGLR